jgi:hypothetical protein
MSNQELRQQMPDPFGEPAPVRVVDATMVSEGDLPESWELPATAADTEDTRDRSFERLPHRPASRAEVPGSAMDDLRRAIGEFGLEQLFVIPRAPRPVGAHRNAWVVTPTQVLAVANGSIAVWLDDGPGPRVRAQVPFADVAAIMDRNILLYGRLELIGPEGSIVVRYNAVGRPELRQLLLPVRRAFGPADTALPAGAGIRPADLPHKWMALVKSTEMQPQGPDRLVVAAGELGEPTPRPHNGVAVLTSRELLVATEPMADIALAQYGVDLLAAPRAHVTSLYGSGNTLMVRLSTHVRPVEIRITTDPSLVAAATTTLGPIVAAGSLVPAGA